MLRIEVFDGDNRVERVTVRNLEPGSPGGRGLQIVTALADSWGTVRHRDGKVVWARLRLPGQERRKRRWRRGVPSRRT